ncbi:MAG: hypothetical protein ACRDRV_00075 [Pseudonocardiaceae bacterium]
MIRFAKGERDGRQGYAWRVSIWVVSTALASVIGVLVTLNTDAIRELISEQRPLDTHVTVSPEYPQDGYSLVVGDPSRLPPNMAEVDDCERMWRIGLDAGGVPSSPSARRVLLQGVAKDGVTVLDMRAKITRRSPAADGALLECPSAGGADPVGLVFDLSESDSAPAQHINKDAEYSGQLVNQFADGFVITVAEKESVPLMVETTLPADAIEWHIEVDVLVGGQRRTIVIDNEGKDFFSPGSRRPNQYIEGHRAGVDTTDWGVDERSRQVSGPDGGPALQFGPVLLPYVPGLDIYQRADTGLSDEGASATPYRWVRRDGRTLLSFNPPGSSTQTLPAVGDVCGESDWYGRDYADLSYGYIRTQSVVASEIRDHGGQQFEHWTIDYQCNMEADGKTRDGDFGTASYWECGGVTCPEETHRIQAARKVGSDVLFVSLSDEVADQDRALAENMLAKLRLTS